MTTIPRKGRLKIFLGYAPGVGKTYQMLDEGEELRRKGMDVVIGYFEPHGRKDTIAKTEGWSSSRAVTWNIVEPYLRRWTSRGSCGGSHRCAWSTSWRIPMSQGLNKPSAGRTCKCCSTLESMY